MQSPRQSKKQRTSSVLFDSFTANLIRSGQSEPAITFDIRNAPIQEEDADAKAAMDNVANALRAVSAN